MNHPPSNVAWPMFDSVDLAGGHRGSGVVGVFVYYLDDSDDSQCTVATMAGYLGRLDDWRKLEEHVTPVFDKYGVQILHNKDLERGHGEFKDWSRLKSDHCL